MKLSTVLKWISGGLETFFGIPVLGWLIVVGSGLIPLFFMFVLHVVTLVFSIRERESFFGSVLGMITSCLAWIPVLGMFMHLVTGIILMVSGYNARKRETEFGTNI